MNYFTGYLGKWHLWEHTPGWAGKTNVGWVLTIIIMASIEANMSIASIEVTSNKLMKLMEKWLGIISMTN